MKGAFHTHKTIIVEDNEEHDEGKCVTRIIDEKIEYLPMRMRRSTWEQARTTEDESLADEA